MSLQSQMVYMMLLIRIIAHINHHEKVNPDNVLVLIKSSLWQSTEARTLSGFDCTWNWPNFISLLMYVDTSNRLFFPWIQYFYWVSVIFPRELYYTSTPNHRDTIWNLTGSVKVNPLAVIPSYFKISSWVYAEKHVCGNDTFLPLWRLHWYPTLFYCITPFRK